MKNSIKISTIIPAVLLVLCACTTAHKATGNKQLQWYKSRTWADGMPQQMFTGFNYKTFYRQYHADSLRWKKAFRFIKETNLQEIAPGKYPIDSNVVFASVTAGSLRAFEQTKWEFHKDYIDIQYIIKGKEMIGVAPVTATPANAFAGIDSSTAKYYTAQPDTLYILFPHDAHRPTIQVPGETIVKKLVIKVKAVALPAE
jgi:YhcH/YjgK/YiaL family protein